MKKYLIYCFIFLILLSGILLFNFKKKNNKNTSTIKVAEVTHSAFYSPLYVAIENGYFEKEGLNIELILTPGADKVSAAVLSKDVEIGFAGAESAIYVYNGGEKDYLKIFSGLTKRDGQFIVGRNKDESFALSKLKGKEILVGRKTGMPAINFLNALKNNNIDPDDIKINYSIEFSQLSGAFVSGSGDYVNLFEPNASSLVSENYGYILESIGKLAGEVPYTTFYSRKSYIAENDEIIKKFVKAIDRGLEFTANNDSIEIAKVILPQFPNLSLDDLTKIVDNYKKADSWFANSMIPESSFKNLENMLIDNHIIQNYIDYEDLIINYE